MATETISQSEFVLSRSGLGRIYKFETAEIRTGYVRKWRLALSESMTDAEYQYTIALPVMYLQV